MQISAVISDDTQQLLETTVRKRGLKKGFVIEAALRHYLLALNAVPDEFIVQPVLTVTGPAWKAVTDALATDAEPTAKMRELMKDG